jgi:hypothetical protein
MRKSAFQLAPLVALSVVLTGCPAAPPPAAPTTPAAPSASTPATPSGEPEGAHTHGAGPHGGTLADWGGGKYHVEFTVDHDKQEATIYVLGSDEKSAAPISADATLQLTIADPAIEAELKAVPEADDPEGQSSRFVGTHENLGIVQEYAGTISGEVDGTPYTGDFKEEPHGHEEE